MLFLPLNTPRGVFLTEAEVTDAVSMLKDYLDTDKGTEIDRIVLLYTNLCTNLMYILHIYIIIFKYHYLLKFIFISITRLIVDLFMYSQGLFLAYREVIMTSID